MTNKVTTPTPREEKDMKKIKYTKTTFNLPFGGYGTFVWKDVKVNKDTVIRTQKNSPVHNDEHEYQDYSAKELFENL